MPKRFLAPVLLFALFFVGMAIVQFATPDMPDNDGFYHIKLAWLMRTEGLKPNFIWLPLSILNEGEFYDHHFLFHVALIPFTFGDLRVGAKWAAVTFSAIAFLSIWYLFHRQKIPVSNSRVHIDRLIKKSDIPEIEAGKLTPFGAEPRSVFLSIEAKRYRYASLYDPLLAMNTCKVDPLPHQIEAVYGFVLQLPRIRFLIADDPGAGKTIMAGLIIKELKLRGLITRTLIIAPGHLKDQWQREMHDRFEENFIKVDRGRMDASYGEIGRAHV